MASALRAAAQAAVVADASDALIVQVLALDQSRLHRPFAHALAAGWGVTTERIMWAVVTVAGAPAIEALLHGVGVSETAVVSERGLERAVKLLDLGHGLG